MYLINGIIFGEIWYKFLRNLNVGYFILVVNLDWFKFYL